MNDESAYYYKKMPVAHFSVDIFSKSLPRGENLRVHWHEHLQLYSFLSGNAVLECGSRRFSASSGSIAVINCNELHYLESLSDDLRFYVIRIDPTFLFSNQTDLLQMKYFAPLIQGRITFQNMIENDTALRESVTQMIREYTRKETGYELAVKAAVYQTIVLLLRDHVGKILTERAFAEKLNLRNRFDTVLQTIDRQYAEKIRIAALAESANLSVCHFCRAFKQITGKTTTDYINGVRLEKAVSYLSQGELNVTEIAMRCGFDSVNYFSRLFHKQYHASPTKFRAANALAIPQSGT